MTVDETGIDPDTNWRQYSHFFTAHIVVFVPKNAAIISSF